MISFFRPDPERMRLKGDLKGIVRLLRTSQDITLRVESALALGRMQTPGAIKELIHSLSDPDLQVVNAASEALVYIGRPVVRPLIIAYNTSDEMISRWIHEILISLGPVIIGDILAIVPQLNEAGEERAAYTILSFGKPALETLCEALGDQNPRISRLAEAIIEASGREAVPFLIQALDDNDDEVQARSASLLILFGDQIIGDLLAFSGQDNDEIHDLKLFIIQEIGRPALGPLYHSLKDVNPVISSMALKIFIELGDSAFGPLVNGLFDENQETKTISETALIRIGESVVPFLIGKIPDHDEGDLKILSSVLVRIGDPAIPYLTRALFNQSPAISTASKEMLPRFGSSAVPVLLDTIQEKGDAAVQQVSDVISAIGKTAFPVLEDSIRTRDSREAVYAIRMLRVLDQVRAVDPLISLLSSPDKQIREAAMNELIQIGNIAAPYLIQALSFENQDTRTLAESALRHIGKGIIPLLVESLSSPVLTDKSSIISIINDSGDDAIPYLIPLLTPGNSGQDLARTLLQEKGSRVVPSLLHALGSASTELYQEIKSLLTFFFRAEPALFISQVMNHPSGDGLNLVTDIISTAPDLVIPHLTPALHHSDKEISRQAGELLISFGDAAIEPLIDAIREESDETNKLIFTQFLIKIGPSAIPSLIAMFKDPAVVVYSVAALGSIGEPAIPSLISLLDDDDDDMVNYAGIALARIGIPALPQLLVMFRTDSTMMPLISGILTEMGGVAVPELMKEFKKLESAREQGSDQGISLMSIILDIALADVKQMQILYSFTDDETNRMLTSFLVSKGNIVIDPIITSLLTWNRPIPFLVIRTFQSMKVQVLSRVHEILKQLPDGDTRKKPLFSLLGDLKDPSSESIIAESLKDSDFQLRSAAVLELGKFGEDALKYLTASMNDENIAVQISAVEAMGEVGLPALDQLLIALKNDRGEIRTAAIKEIGRIGDPAKFMLIQALNDKDRNVRRDVIQLLDSLSWKPKYTTDKLSYYFAKEDWDSLVRIGPPSTDILSRGVEDRDEEIKAACREALKKIRNSLPSR